ncbi:MAG: hypothetical protein A2075_22890 [Geobacteraceae bacterium GWC2_58_44]|nr:MAG: hypothetical protein A2075_22890 [Geobacteraceae bacterium GWC2_58_44]
MGSAFKGRVGVGMGQLRRKNTPIPLLTSPLKGEEPEQRKIGANQDKFKLLPADRSPSLDGGWGEEILLV